MNAYIYRAALYCEDCAPRRSGEHPALPAPVRPHWGPCGDSDCCPQGPYPNGGGESDYPQHCDACRTFLENPLTDDGRAYVEEAIELFDHDESGDAAVINEWREFYADTLVERIGS